jgi:hypothetical protein
MSEESLRVLIMKVSNDVELVFNKNHRIIPGIVWDDGSAPFQILPLPFNNKDMNMGYIRFCLKEMPSIKRYCFVDEAWMLMVSTIGRNIEDVEKESEKHFKEGIRNDPDRVEVILYSAEDEILQILAHQKIIRGMGVPRLGGLEFMPSKTHKSKGRMVGLMPNRGSKQ